MPRKKRRKDAGLVRHVVSRGDGRERIFLDDRDYQKFYFLLHETVEDYDVECRDVCLMPNHFHLTLFNVRENLSDAMQFLKGEYASWWNGAHEHVGHVFEGPFKDQIVEERDYSMSLARYIALNPVRAGLVERPEDWPWSAYRYFAGLAEPPEFLSCAPVLRLFGEGDDEELRERYVRFVLTVTPRELMREEAFRSRQRVIGSREFKQRMKPPARPASTSRYQPSAVFTPGFV
jgi:putative transposase